MSLCLNACEFGFLGSSVVFGRELFAGDLIDFGIIGADEQTIALEFEEVACDCRNPHVDSVAVDSNGSVAGSDCLDDVRHINEAVLDGCIGRFVAFDCQNQNGLAIEVGVGRVGIRRRAPCEVFNDFSADLLQVKFFGEVEGSNGGACAVGRGEERNGVAADGNRTEGARVFVIERGEFSFHSACQ